MLESASRGLLPGGRGVSALGGVSAWGVSAPGVSAPGGCLLQGWCLLWGCVSALGGVCSQGGCLLPGGGGVCSREVSAPGDVCSYIS